MEGQARKVVYELIGAFVIILLLMVLRPLFVGQVAQAGSNYAITYTNGSTETIQPTATLSVGQTDAVYSVVIFVVALAALVVILLTVAGKI